MRITCIPRWRTNSQKSQTPTVVHWGADFREILEVVDEDHEHSPLAHLQAHHAHVESVARRDVYRRNVEEIMRLKCNYAGDVLEGALTEGQPSHVKKSCHM